MSTGTPFNPTRGQNKRVSVTTTASIVTVGAGTHSLRIVNEGTDTIFFTTYKAGEQPLVATAAGTVVPKGGAAGSVLVIEKPFDHDTVSVMAASGTQIVDFQIGEGGS